MNKRKSVIIGALLLLISTGAWATSATISWNPNRLAPASIAPGESQTIPLSFTNKGPSSINGAKLSVEVRGEAGGVVSVTQPTFPQTIKKGETVQVTLTLHSSLGTPLRVVTGILALVESKPNNTAVKDTFSATLPLEITLSPFSLPPDPGEMGKMTVEGIDIGGNPDGTPNGVRDDIDRYIAFTFPNSQKARMGLTQYAKEDQKFVADFLATASDPVEQKRVTRENDVERSKASECSLYALGAIDRKKYDFNPDGTIVGDLGRKDEETFRKAIIERKKLKAQFLNTTERQVVFGNADALLGGTGGGDEGDDRTLCQGFGFDPDLLPN